MSLTINNNLTSFFKEKSASILISRSQSTNARPAFKTPGNDNLADLVDVAKSKANKTSLPTSDEITKPQPDSLNYREILKCAIPPLVGNITATGHLDKTTAEDRGKLFDIVNQYFTTIREEFGCTTSDYMPYLPDLPEYDPAIEKAMRAALNEIVINDPECERLINDIGGIFPPPDHFDPYTMWTGNIVYTTPDGQMHKSYIPQRDMNKMSIPITNIATDPLWLLDLLNNKDKESKLNLHI